MKKIVVGFVSAAAALACVGASAGSSVDLFVKGRIVPASCNINVSNNTVDLGDMLASELSQDSVNPLKGVHANFAIDCNAPTLVAIRPIDNRPGTAYGPDNHEAFGMGLDSAGNRIGSYKMYMDISSSYGLTPIGSYNEGATWKSLVLFSPRKGTLHAAGKYKDGVWEVQPITSITGFFAFEYMELAPMKNLSLGDEVKIDGHATVELVYL